MSICTGCFRQVRGLKACGDLEKRDQLEAEREIPARDAQRVLGWERAWVGGCFASMVGIKETTIRQYVRHQG